MAHSYRQKRSQRSILSSIFSLNPQTAQRARNERLIPSEWARRYRRIDDKSFTLDNHLPLKQIYDDDHPHIVILKCAQVGVSEMAITKVCHALDIGADYWGTGKAGLNVGYLFPTQAALSDFSKERFSSLRTESARLEQLFTTYDDVGFKQAGASYLYLRGTSSTKTLKSFPADMLVLDERDEMQATAVALAEKRLRASVLKRKIELSTPTLPGTGIHAVYLQSDQHVYHQQCDLCGEWIVLDFFRDVYLDNQSRDVWQHWTQEQVHRAVSAVACPACKSAFNRCKPGIWIAQSPENTRIRGYHIPPLAFPMVDLTDLAIKSISNDPTVLTEFYRSDLGLPYEPAGSRVTIDMLRQLAVSYPTLPNANWRNVTMGIDVGSRFHYRISATGKDGDRFILAMGNERSWDALGALLSRYKVRRCVIDAMPENHGAKAFQEAHRGIVLRAFYPAATAMKGELWRIDEDKGTIQINRTSAMDTVYARIAGALEHWPATIINDSEVQRHTTAPVRIVTKDDSGQEVASWHHIAPDHLYHAAVYDVIAQLSLPKVLGGFAQGKVKGWNPR